MADGGKAEGNSRHTVYSVQIVGLLALRSGNSPTLVLPCNAYQYIDTAFRYTKNTSH